MEEAKIEKKIKKNKNKNKVASLLLALALILTCGVAGTIAQYQKSFGGNATATVASFKVDATGLNETKDANIDLFSTILDTEKAGANNADGTNSYIEGDVNGAKIAPGTQGFTKLEVSNDSDVKVQCKFTIDKKDGSKWSATYNKKTNLSDDDALDLLTTEDIPLEFALYVPQNASDVLSTDSGKLDATIAKLKTIDSNYKTLADFNADKTNQQVLDTTLDYSEIKTVYLCWRWAYSKGDETASVDALNRNRLDTAIGEAVKADANSIKPELTITAKFTQIN